MSWSSDFKSGLQSQSIAPRYMLRFVSFANCPGSDLVIYSDSGSLQIDAEGPTINGSSVIPGSWSITFGSFSVPLAGDIRPSMTAIRKGSFADLWVSLGGNYERVAMGQLRTLNGFGSRWVLQFADMVSALQSRADGVPSNTGVNDPSHFAFFRYFDGFGTVNNVYASPNLYVTDISIFEKETGENGLIKITEGGSSDFWEWSAKTTTSAPAGYLTISATHVYPVENAAVSPINGSTTVHPCALLKGYPGHILAKLITSTGTGTNGTYDTLPLSWGAGGFDASLVDVTDMDNVRSWFRSQGGSGNSYLWEYAVTNPWNTGLRDFVNAAAVVGQWPVWRQDRLSWRGCNDLTSTTAYYHIAASITDEDIIGVDSIEIFSGDQNVIYGVSKYKYAVDKSGASYTTGGASLTIDGHTFGLPAQNEIERDTHLYYDATSGNPYTSGGRTNRQNFALGDQDRLRAWDQRTYTKINIQVHMRLCRLVCGDVVEVTSRYLWGIDEAYTGGYFHNKKAMVLGVSYSFQARSCSLTLAVLHSS